MLSKTGSSVGGGDMAADKKKLAETLITEFEAILERLVDENKVPRRYIRPLLSGSIVCGYLGGTFYVGYQQHLGLPTLIFTTLTGSGKPDVLAYFNFLVDTFGPDFCVLQLEESWGQFPDREAALASVASKVIENELARATRESSMIQDRFDIWT
jgi:hypothetical protein